MRDINLSGNQSGDACMFVHLSNQRGQQDKTRQDKNKEKCRRIEANGLRRHSCPLHASDDEK